MAIYEVKVDNTKEWTVSDYLELEENPNQQLIRKINCESFTICYASKSAEKFGVKVE